jgi:hypothetical protein
MEGNNIENVLSLLISANPNISFMATHFGQHIRQYGEKYWEEQIETRRLYVSDSNVRNGIEKWLENRKYTRQELLSVIRDKYTTKEKNLPYTKLQRKILFQ